jgi:hypothetical protein
VIGLCTEQQEIATYSTSLKRPVGRGPEFLVTIGQIEPRVTTQRRAENPVPNIRSADYLDSIRDNELLRRLERVEVDHLLR